MKRTEVKTASISLKKEPDGSYSVSGGHANQEHSVANGVIKVPKSVAERLISWYNKIFGTHITLGD